MQSACFEIDKKDQSKEISQGHLWNVVRQQWKLEFCLSLFIKVFSWEVDSSYQMYGVLKDWKINIEIGII